MEFKCVFDNCPVHMDPLDSQFIVDHFTLNHGSIIVPILDDKKPLEMKIDYIKAVAEENGSIAVPYLLCYKGLIFLFCASWDTRFECWVYKLGDEATKLDGWKVDWVFSLKSAREMVSDKDNDITLENAFMITTSVAEIRNLKTGLSTSWMAMFKNFFETEEDKDDGIPFCFVEVSMEFIEPEPEPEPEVPIEVQHSDKTQKLDFDEINISHLTDAEETAETDDYTFMCPNCDCILGVFVVNKREETL